MKVLSIGMDRKLFEEGSAVLSRSLEYAKKMDELHIIVFTRGRKFEDKKIGNLYIYPTYSISKIHYIFDAIKIGRRIINDKKLTPKDSILSTQDPFETGYVGLRLKKQFNLQLQVQIHTDFFSRYFKSSFLNIIRLFLARLVIPKADQIRVVNDYIKDCIYKRFNKIKAEVVVLPIFVPIQEIINYYPKMDLSKEFPKFKFIILMASRLTSEKRVDLALRAFKNVLLKFPQTGLVIAGDGKEKSRLMALAKNLKISKNIAFLGWQNDLISLYKTADVFLLTSKYEGYGMTLVEAAASGCPIITTNVGLAKTSLFSNGKNSIICEQSDAGCIPNALMDIISDNSKRELFKRAMQDNIKSTAITQDEYVSRYVEHLAQLLHD